MQVRQMLGMVGALAAIIVPGAGAATWTSPAGIDQGEDYHALALAAVPGGDVVAVATRGDGTAASWLRTPASALWSPLALDPALAVAGPDQNGCALPSMAVAPGGTVTLVCASRAAVSSTDLLAGASTWSPPQVVQGTAPEQPCAIQAVVGTDGTAAAAIGVLPLSNKEGCATALLTRPPGGASWSSPRIGADDVAAGGDGTLVAAFVDSIANPQRAILRVSVRRPGTGWSTPRAPARAAAFDLGFLRAAVSRAGDVAIGWSHGRDIDVATLPAGSTRWSCRPLRAGGRSSCIGVAEPRANDLRRPFRALQGLTWTPTRRLVALWQQAPSSYFGLGQLTAAFLARGRRAWSAPVVLDTVATTTSDESFVPQAPSASGETTFGAQIAVDRGGGVLVAWTRIARIGAVPTVRVARLVPGGARFGRPTDLVSSGAAEDVTLVAPSDAPAQVAWIDAFEIYRTLLVAQELG